MSRTQSGTFTTEIKINGRDEMNFCFRDSADNWDNNNGTNWNVDIRNIPPPSPLYVNLSVTF